MGSGKKLREAKERPLELRKKTKVTCLGWEEEGEWKGSSRLQREHLS